MGYPGHGISRGFHYPLLGQDSARFLHLCLGVTQISWAVADTALFLDPGQEPKNLSIFHVVKAGFFEGEIVKALAWAKLLS